MEKSQIREKMLKLRNEISEQDRIDYSNKITEIVINSEIYKNFSNICIYEAFRGEVLCDRIRQQALSDHKKVFLPVTNKETKSIFFYEIDFNTVYQKGAYGILEPVTDDDTRILYGPALILMPGLAFDCYKHRIGYGGGYYDRFLEQQNEYKTIALCYSFQIVNETLPYEEFDVLPDYVVTEKGMF